MRKFPATAISRLLRRFGSAAVGAVLLFLVAPGASAATEIKVLQLNICHSGIADCFSGDSVIMKAGSVIRSVRPQVLSVNEVCSGDVEPLRAAMGPASTQFVAALRRDGSPVKCTNGQEYGSVIMVANGLAGSPGASGRYTAQDGSNEQRVWACLPAGGLAACTTHLSAASGSTALAQCKELMTRAAKYATGAPVVVSGDMNLRFRGDPDVQACNHAGFYRKGDGSVQHVFATTDLHFRRSDTIDLDGTSDHPGLLVTVSKS